MVTFSLLHLTRCVVTWCRRHTLLLVYKSVLVTSNNITWFSYGSNDKSFKLHKLSCFICFICISLFLSIFLYLSISLYPVQVCLLHACWLEHAHSCIRTWPFKLPGAHACTHQHLLSCAVMWMPIHMSTLAAYCPFMCIHSCTFICLCAVILCVHNVSG